MAALEEMNPHKGTATDAQALFCAINTASVQIIPASVIALRAAAGASQPGDIIGPTLLATSCAVVAAVAAAKVLGWVLPKPPAARPSGPAAGPAAPPPSAAPPPGGPRA
jgi:spore maturation protein A